MTTSEAPPWLSVMRTLTGTKEVAGAEANPVITGMADTIKQRFPDMAAYCDQAAWNSDETPWCGMAAANCMALSNVRPPFGATDTDRWGWARSWADDPGFVALGAPRLGCVVVLERSGGGHVTFYESTSGSNYMCRGGNQGDAVTLAPFPKANVVALTWPKDVPLPEVPPSERPTLQTGSTGPEVSTVQRTLGIPVDGDFGPVTDAAVKGFQSATGLAVDGVVGSMTWEQLDALTVRVEAGTDGFDQATISAIVELAENSAIAGYSWAGRSVAPKGYTAGVALAFALAFKHLTGIDGQLKNAVGEMAQADRNDPNTDALSWYRSKFQALGMDNNQDGVDTLRHLFALMMGLGMRESSGRYCEGRDFSATNTTAETAEAGCWQTSWNIRTCNQQIPPLLPMYWENPCGFRDSFAKGVNPKASDLTNYGSGSGAQYQWLSKYAPAFHAYVTAIGMRFLRKHWGPLNRSEVELKAEADDMLWQVQELVASGVEPEPVPPVEAPTITISINPPGSAQVVIIGSAS